MRKIIEKIVEIILYIAVATSIGTIIYMLGWLVLSIFAEEKIPAIFIGSIFVICACLSLKSYLETNK